MELLVEDHQEQQIGGIDHTRRAEHGFVGRIAFQMLLGCQELL